MAFKREVVQASLDTTHSQTAIAMRFEIHPDMLCRWRREMVQRDPHQNKPVKNRGPKGSQRQLEQENRRLRKQLERAELENETLKKAEEYFVKTRNKAPYRLFHADQPDPLWMRPQDSWRCLAMVMDLHSRRIVGWAHGRQNDSQLVLQALEHAWSDRRPDNPGLFHSDQGSQYCSAPVMHWLTRKGFTSSMSRRGNCWDNACAESFCAQMKTEWIRPLGELSRTEMQAEVDDDIDGFYNTVRIHGTLNGVPPLQLEAAA